MSYQDIESNEGPSPSKQQRATSLLSSGVFQINTRVSAFKKLVNNLGTPKDTVEGRKQLHKLRQQIGNMVKDTSDALKEASKIDHSVPGSASKKYEDAKLARDFQAVLQDFQAVQKKAAEWEAAYTPFVPEAVLPSSYTAGELNLTSQESREDRAMLVEQRRQDVLRLENEVMFNETIIEEREESIREIQNQIGEVHEIFSDLAVLVREQGNIIGEVETNVDSSEALTRDARRHLSRAEESQKSGTSLTCLLVFLFGVLLLVILIVFVA
ncbi:hypothetical protein SELMODRAFT_142582 [Selaginella moellendorffii]|uniref:t-SNARE coiled-coil homology domain-containing protein n=1 Tax=Selaginella moellendorffii TaxID=88036 RepID=D8R0B3_SELML|nr:syntaxin-22 [Selaginella moellendorffii]EFJ34549.1 hypothetical protein SELMODRAFT_142582 [Selaginella moellendorffii]|eukprot:XP_024524754.1 syntaxin-22 [Selaginella moellendorffii]